MLLMRPVKREDLQPILDLSTKTGFGLSTLPTDPEYVEEKIDDSVQAFGRIPKKPRGEAYLFVMEDLETGEVIGTSGIVSKVGGFEPFYSYQIQDQPLHSEILNVHKTIQVLHLVAEYNGPTEIGSLFLRPDYQKRGLGQLLASVRFLFMAEFPQHFERTVIAELRGIVDEHAYSPFWEAIGRHFFTIDYPKADYLSMKNKQFIAELMPKHPLYIPLLPKDAQAVIGEVHEQTRPALKRLEKEGFTRTDLVDIFEAGPVLSCDRDAIATIRRSDRGVVRRVAETEPEGEACIIGNSRHHFRACYGRIGIDDQGGLSIGPDVAKALELQGGEPVRYVPLSR